MNVAVSILQPSSGDARRESLGDAADGAKTAATLSEATARDALALRHASTTPGAIALICQIAETAVIALALWGGARGWTLGDPLGPLAALAVAVALAGAATMAGRAVGAYAIGSLRRFFPGFLRLTLAGAAVGAAALQLAPGGEAAGAAALAAFGAALATRLTMSPTVAWCVTAGMVERRALIVGGGPAAETLVRELDATPERDIRVVGVFDDRSDDRSPPLVAGARKLGSVADLMAFARIAHVDMVIIALPLSAERRIRQLVETLWVLPVDIRLAALAADASFRRRSFGVEGGFLDVSRRRLGGTGLVVKRLLDAAVAAAALVALSPVLIATAVAVRLDSPGPILFRQLRHGFNDRPVEVWKFRSMRHEAADPTARKVVTRDDDRVTRVGRFIRRTSIDELPQLFNVLGGGMSLVGPRPHVMDAVSSRNQSFGGIVAGYSARHRVKPGVTGWAQINGWRGEIDDPEKLRRRFEHDLFYIENWSVWLDLKILALTPVSLLRTDNAY